MKKVSAELEKRRADINLPFSPFENNNGLLLS